MPTQNTDIINKKVYILLFIIYLAPKLLNIVGSKSAITSIPFLLAVSNITLNSLTISSVDFPSADKRQVNKKIERYLNLNNLRSLEESYYGSKKKGSGKKNPFKITKLKKGNKRKKLSVEYPVVSNWIGNLSFLIDFKHSVVLGEPENTTGK